jgi:hypothetical protein
LTIKYIDQMTDSDTTEELDWMEVHDEKTGELFYREHRSRGEIRPTNKPDLWVYWITFPPAWTGGRVHCSSGDVLDPEEAMGLIEELGEVYRGCYGNDDDQ